jgi:hypothetical protein
MNSFVKAMLTDFSAPARLVLPHHGSAPIATEDASRSPALRSKEDCTQLCPGPAAGTWSVFFLAPLVGHASPVLPPPITTVDGSQQDQRSAPIVRIFSIYDVKVYAR